MPVYLSIVASAVGGYIIASAVCFKYPTLLHKKKNLKFIARHISHRGGAGEYYENTMGSFRRAVGLGTDMLEIDCQITKDGKVVVAHDNNLSRLAGIDCDISSLNYDELPLLKLEMPIDFEPDKLFRHPDPENADRCIPLLEDVFKTFKNIPINIDIKRDDELLIDEVSRLITTYNREDICIWGNALAEITEKCYKKNPNVNVLFSRKKVLKMLLFYYSGLLPFIPLKETNLEIFAPLIYKKWAKKSNDTVYNILLHLMDLLLIRKSLFSHLNKRGIQTYLWVLNEEEEFRRAFEKGATGVMTDYPTKLAEFLKHENCNVNKKVETHFVRTGVKF